MGDASPLTAGQQRIYDLVVKERKSVFYTGEAGTGKTHVADAIISALADAGINVVVCASTGQAAQHLENGVTAHALFGLAPPKTGTGPAQRVKGWALEGALRAAETIIIDEISMVSRQLFEDMNRRLQLLHANNVPFGGVQVVALGDFLQLPPVNEPYCFHAPCFNQIFGNNCLRLTKQMRQEGDVEFATHLRQIRTGLCTYAAESALRMRLCSERDAPPARDVTYLYCLRNHAELKNKTCLDALPFEQHVWQAKDWLQHPKFASLLNACVLDEQLTLKTDAPVILRKNIDLCLRLVNGTRGCVKGIVRSCELWGPARPCFDPECKHTKSSTHYPLLGEAMGETRFPVVEFHGVSYAVGMIKIEKFVGVQSKTNNKRKAGDEDNRRDRPVAVASRTQIPLTLGFALTVHRAQGMTLPRACIAWNNAFAEGQIYVALSRVRKLDDLSIISSYIPTKRITAASDALAFEKHIRDAE